jgi:hypothetical protein
LTDRHRRRLTERAAVPPDKASMRQRLLALAAAIAAIALTAARSA